MSINILVNGAFGRMGQITVDAIADDPKLALVGQIGREYDLKKSIRDSEAQVVIDFTRPESVFENAKMIIEEGVCPVIGTSGLTLDQIQALQDLCAKQKLGGLVVPNFSLGAVLMMKYAQQIVRYMPNVEIIEMHHSNKADSPSGTAMRTADLLGKACNTINQPEKASHEIIPHARGANYQAVPIHSIRLPGLLAHQQIIFGNAGETLTLRHDSIDRKCFMPGICFACEKVITLDQLVYGLEHIL
jgi:4-hydroxy-tetrahydrodipicolinate reductase